MKNEDLGRFYPSKKKPDSGRDNFIRKSDDNGGGGSADFSTVTGVTYNTTDGADIAYDGGSKLTLPIKGGNGITVDAASDNKSLEVKVGDRINIAGEQTLSIGKWIKFISNGVIVGNDIGGLKITYSPGDSEFVTAFDFDYTFEMACRLLIHGEETGAVVSNDVGPNITWSNVVLVDYAPGLWAKGLDLCYKIDDVNVPADATSGTLPDNKSFTYLKENPEQLRLLFNKEYYNLSDNQHTTGTLVFSHVGYENSSFILKTITITLATRGWVLTAGKVATTPLE